MVYNCRTEISINSVDLGNVSMEIDVKNTNVMENNSLLYQEKTFPSHNLRLMKSNSSASLTEERKMIIKRKCCFILASCTSGPRLTYF